MALIFGMGATEIGLILIIALIVLGPQKLPELALRFGKTLGDLRRATGEFQREFMRAQHDFNEFKDQTVGEVRRGFEFQRPEQGNPGAPPQPALLPRRVHSMRLFSTGKTALLFEILRESPAMHRFRRTVKAKRFGKL